MLDRSSFANLLLAQMQPADLARVMDRAEPVDLLKGVDLALSGDLVSHGWFPETGLISVIASNSAGDEAEIGMIGKDGFAHTSLILGSDRHNQRLLVQITGKGFRIERNDFQAAMTASPHLTRLMLIYVEAFSVQTGSSALAFARRTVIGRLSRWLVMCSDRVGDDVCLTHEALSVMLGVRRAGVSNALSVLADGGLIEVSRGNQRVLDRAGLIQIAGGSYGDAEAEAQRLFERVTPKSLKDGRS